MLIYLLYLTFYDMVHTFNIECMYLKCKFVKYCKTVGIFF